MKGIESVLFGTFTSESGKVVIDEAGFYDLIATADSEVAENVKNQFHNAQKLITAIPTPFDQSIMAEEGGPEHQAIQAAVAAVWEFVYTLSDAEEAMQLSAKGR